MNVRPPLRTFASATLFAALCFAQPFALAQNGGDGKGTLTVEGEVTDSTCVVNFKDATAGSQASSSSTLKLTPVKRADLDKLTAGNELTATQAKFTIVSLGTSTAGTSCSLDNSKGTWDFEINANNTTTFNNKVLLKSALADSGSSASRSNVWVQLKAKVIDDLTITPDTTTGVKDVQPINSENLGVQLLKSGLGLIDEAGVFVPIDLNKPQTLNKALNQDDGKTLTLGIRYVASRSLLSEVASLQATNPGSQDVTAGNVSVFLPFLLKLN